MKEFLSKLGEVLFWLFMLACLIGLLMCNQYTGYRQAEKNILKSCITKNEFIVEDIKFTCNQIKENNVQNN